ncbi:procyclic acidic repetitive family protein [Dolichospermum circinale]|uniref:procyclic acidic repetitive family protein n=1 Tax=Dolichospermum circinale TaxID=109265 RepID=UPI00232FBB07|nr:procyclic acidic repetitive family protein [Dolichospermum circinale]MDB9465501.1 procyclic acidic repetitive family protein [Dolichospermum circinale CS-539/09]MDB9472639.1 procyclic acidic repetitive family protein [Dolichospermum circinale CS-539]
MSGKNAPKSRNEPVTTLYKKNQPIWKTAIIQVLRGTIGVLETTIVKLETETPKDTSGKKINFLSRWDGFLRTFRLFLPSSISNNVSDSLLTGIFAVIFLVTIGITIFLYIPKSTQVAVVPPVEEVTKPTPVIEPEPKPTPVIEPEPKPTPVIEPKPTPTPVIEPEPKPTPVIELTPEASLLVAIENQFSEISVSVKNTKDKNKDKNIVSQLIKPLGANFRTSDLTLKISDMWYSLEKSQQDKLAADILQRSQELNFTHLKIVDSQEKMIARSPVVGNEMIIFQR